MVVLLIIISKEPPPCSEVGRYAREPLHERSGAPEAGSPCGDDALIKVVWVG